MLTNLFPSSEMWSAWRPWGLMDLQRWASEPRAEAWHQLLPAPQTSYVDEARKGWLQDLGMSAWNQCLGPSASLLAGRSGPWWMPAESLSSRGCWGSPGIVLSPSLPLLACLSCSLANVVPENTPTPISHLHKSVPWYLLPGKPTLLTLAVKCTSLGEKHVTFVHSSLARSSYRVPLQTRGGGQL